MNASQTARARARAELSREIKDEARRQLASEGAARLSLRAVARELGMVSSALYRYYPSRDDLLTALIVDAYEAAGVAAESAADPSLEPRKRWRAACLAVRSWAHDHPHEYALVYGSPVPGYRAPADTVDPAQRVPMTLINIVRDAWTSGARTGPPSGPPLSDRLAEQVSGVAERFAPELPADVLARTIIAWTQLFGAISFELFGHLVGSVDPSEEFFRHATEQMATFVGLPD